MFFTKGNEMKKEIAETWSHLLRSGEFKQGTHWLEHSDYYCVNGILCLIALTEGVTDYSKLQNMAFFNQSPLFPPQAVLKWAKVKEESLHRLAKWNDEGMDFNKLAEYIDENWNRL